MGAITEIFRTVGPEYLERFPDIPLQHKKTIDAIINCRSGEFGQIVYQCQECGQQHSVDRSCGNRHCPQCQYHKSRQWLDTQLDRRLPGHHFMLTFTMPEQLRPFCRSHQRAAYSAMFKAASGAIKKLARDPRFSGADSAGVYRRAPYLGTPDAVSPPPSSHRPGWWPVRRPGTMATVREELLSPGQGPSPRSSVANSKPRMTRRKLVGSIDPAVWKIDWNVNSQAVGDSEATYKYLAPYIFRVAISDSRIVNIKDGEVTFSYRHKESNRPRQTTVDTIEFIRRFLQHVLPTGFMKVRHYGLMSSNCPIPRSKLRLMVLSVLAALQGKKVSLTDLKTSKDVKAPMPQPKCRLCGGILLYLFSVIPGRPCRGST